MLAVPAHSFVQQARLAVSLSWIGGFTNAVTIVACAQVTSHMTGAVSQFGVALVDANYELAVYLFALVTTFTLGALLAGLLLEVARARRWLATFALPIAVEAVLLVVFSVWLWLVPEEAQKQALGPTLLAAATMGLQNATITRISGGVVRTTHVTGVVTDLGLDLARFVARWFGLARPLSPRRSSQARRRLWLLASIPASFAFGAALGTWTFHAWPLASIALPVGFLLVVLLLQLNHGRAVVALEAQPSQEAKVAWFRAVPPAAAEYRLPDLAAWASHVDPRHRVLVLDVAALPGLDDLAALELRALLRALREERRQLVLAGVDEDQLQALDDAGVLLDFDADDVCHDQHAAELRAHELVLAMAA